MWNRCARKDRGRHFSQYNHYQLSVSLLISKQHKKVWRRELSDWYLWRTRSWFELCRGQRAISKWTQGRGTSAIINAARVNVNWCLCLSWITLATFPRLSTNSLCMWCHYPSISNTSACFASHKYSLHWIGAHYSEVKLDSVLHYKGSNHADANKCKSEIKREKLLQSKSACMYVCVCVCVWIIIPSGA